MYIYIYDLHIYTIHLHMYIYIYNVIYIYIYGERENRGIAPASKESPVAVVFSGSAWAPESSQKGPWGVLPIVYCLVAVRLEILIIII